MRIHENELLTFKVSTSVRHLLTSFLSSSTFVAKDSICAVITNTDNHFKTRKKRKENRYRKMTEMIPDFHGSHIVPTHCD